MHKSDAQRVLGISPDTAATPEHIRRQYRILALQFHPDKCKSPDATEQFQRIQEAYQTLVHAEEDRGMETAYDDLMDRFLASMNPEHAVFVKKILRVLSNPTTMYYLKQINRETLTKLAEFMSLYKDAFHLDEDFLSRFPARGDTADPEQTYILNPLIENLMCESVYCLRIDGHTFVVPLWNHEMTYEHPLTGREFAVACYPVLPENMEIDELNILSVRVSADVADVWDRGAIYVAVGKTTVDVPTSGLRLTSEPQLVEVADVGVFRINPANPFDVDRRQPIRFYVSLRV